jgi:hypothetical protein
MLSNKFKKLFGVSDMREAILQTNYFTVILNVN